MREGEGCKDNGAVIRRVQEETVLRLRGIGWQVWVGVGAHGTAGVSGAQLCALCLTFMALGWDGGADAHWRAGTSRVARQRRVMLSRMLPFAPCVPLCFPLPY